MRQVTPAASDFFLHHPWPGNVRQLENCIEHGVIFAEGDVLDLEHLRGFFGEGSLPHGPAASGEPVSSTGVQSSFGGSLKGLEEWYIVEALKRFGTRRL